MANKIWEMFGPQVPGSKALRPFGSAVIDGFDFDFEAMVNNMPAFGNQLRSLMDAAGSPSREFLLTAAPQCPYPGMYPLFILPLHLSNPLPPDPFPRSKHLAHTTPRRR
jgi:chitinase